MPAALRLPDPSGTDESLTELRISRERTAILGVLARAQADAAATEKGSPVAIATGLP
ncbi:hypothetical protein J2M53_04655 [Arthrobacter sp. zg-ZUI100]|uniref:hypothetical protein n=1 Tax=Arthrobacter jiangjiafuii TaxID=2817475 RepID=UPI001AEDE236|nr:hypothetical protein [Arthrobacter jiangjiafuii]MBP3035547.1 hypothetical protein [Arthrobacter jiangjiafuii]